MKWILILTLYFDGGYDGGPAVSAVNGFQDRESCLAAGNAWLKKTRAGLGWPPTFIAAQCVPDRSKP